MYQELLLIESRRKQYNDAIEKFEKCSRLDAHHPYTTNNIAYVYILLKKDKEAADACSEAYNVNRVAKNYFRNWAIALMNQKIYNEASEVIKKAIEMEPIDPSMFLCCYV